MRHIGKRGVILAAVLVVAGSAFLADHVATSRRLDRLLTDANAAIDRRDFPSASARLNEYLRDRPDDLPVRLLAAQTARRQGDFDAAHSYLSYYQEHGGPDESRLREQQLLLAQEDDTPDVDVLMESCLEPSPPPDVDLVLEVVIERQLKRIDRAFNAGKTLVDGPSGKARAETEQAIAIWLQRRASPADQVQGLIWRGRLHLLTDQRAAIDDFRRATEIDPDHFNARMNLARSLIEYDVNEAGRHLELLNARDPQNPQVIMMLAQVRRSLGQPAAAIELLDQLLRRNPTAAALLERGKAALDLGKPTEAEPFLQKALDQTPDNPFVHLALSRCLLLTGHEAEAKEHERLYKDLQQKRLKAEDDLAESRRQWQNKEDRADRAPRTGPPGR
jgi:tetratricopeptide (TPR) repeat protein